MAKLSVVRTRIITIKECAIYETEHTDHGTALRNAKRLARNIKPPDPVIKDWQVIERDERVEEVEAKDIGGEV